MSGPSPCGMFGPSAAGHAVPAGAGLSAACTAPACTASGGKARRLSTAPTASAWPPNLACAAGPATTAPAGTPAAAAGPAAAPPGPAAAAAGPARRDKGRTSFASAPSLLRRKHTRLVCSWMRCPGCRPAAAISCARSRSRPSAAAASDASSPMYGSTCSASSTAAATTDTSGQLTSTCLQALNAGRQTDGPELAPALLQLRSRAPAWLRVGTASRIPPIHTPSCPCHAIPVYLRLGKHVPGGDVQALQQRGQHAQRDIVPPVDAQAPQAARARPAGIPQRPNLPRGVSASLETSKACIGRCTCAQLKVHRRRYCSC